MIEFFGGVCLLVLALAFGKWLITPNAIELPESPDLCITGSNHDEEIIQKESGVSGYEQLDEPSRRNTEQSWLDCLNAHTWADESHMFKRGVLVVSKCKNCGRVKMYKEYV